MATDGDHAAGVMHAIAFDAEPRTLEPADALAGEPDPARPVWLHLDRTNPAVHAWVQEQATIPPAVREVLLAPETRPRVDAIGGGLLVNVRGVNLNPGNDPEDMIALRGWMVPGRLLTLAGLPLAAVNSTADAVVGGPARGPTGDPDFWRPRPATPASAYARILLGLMRRAATVADGFDDEIDALEDRIGALRAEGRGAVEESALAEPQVLRRRALEVRRWLAPQRDVVQRLARDERFSDDDRNDLAEAAEGFARVVDVLEAVRDRATVLGDEIAQVAQARLDRRVYGLTLVAAIFLPLGFVTGLLGINVGGIPGSDEPFAFGLVTLGLLGTGVALAWVFRHARWL